jgi:predicted DNA-binding protein (UPF0251 family)/DNA-directed RNA polymerase subunit RPC12/RpoP
MSPRPRRKRILKIPPAVSGFVPESGDYDQNEKITLRFEEYEAIKLSDYDMLTHLEASKQLNVSRPTFTRIYDSARKKIAKAFVENKRIVIEGGDVDFEDTWYRCMDCGTVYKGEEVADNDNGQVCPVCASENVVPLQEAVDYTQSRWGFGRHRGRGFGGSGAGGYCICPKCGYKVPHTAGTPCNANLCPECNIRLIRENSEHHRFVLRKRGKGER